MRLLMLPLLLLFAGPALAQPPLQAVPELDLARYAGNWHEIARLPMYFQRNCASNTTATYTPREDGKLSVRNACLKADGSRMVSEGVARLAGTGPGKLEVRFAPDWLSALSFVWADYWVIALDADYRWAIVGEPGREYLWILSREPAMDAETLDGLKARARMLGYDLAELIVAPAPR
ncbi:MAG: lipocalin family protein [Arenimonas sp.]|nr:lipocalin family protein [Arenimonas sp.]